MAKKKYTTDFKLNIVKRYLSENISFKMLADMYFVDKGDIQKWLALYQEHGVEGLTVFNGTYTGDFKVSVVEYMHNTGFSARKTAAYFNIPTYTTVCVWERKYLEEGPGSLMIERRGRSNFMDGKKKGRKPIKDKTDKEDLIAEVQRLRMENEYLKKLNALIQEREKSVRKTK